MQTAWADLKVHDLVRDPGENSFREITDRYIIDDVLVFEFDDGTREWIKGADQEELVDIVNGNGW